MNFAAQLHPAGSRTGIVWEEPDCLLCGGDRRTLLLEAPDSHPGARGLWFAVVRCAECGLCFTSPRPDQATIGQFYPAGYRPHRRPRPERDGHRSSPLAFVLGRPCIERRVLGWHGRGRLLDFGCGGGVFLGRMHRQGWQVTGIDASTAAVARARADLGVPVVCGTLPHPDLEPESFDVVTMWHSLEHVHDPLAVLSAARRLLAPGGRLVVAVPNIDSAPFRWFGPAWFGLDLPRHLIHFTPLTLRRMIEKAGFGPPRLRLIRHSDWLRSSAKLARRLGRPPLWQLALTRKPLAKLVALGCYAARRSDCLLAVANKESAE
jgi:SAM-dependent methyltransferase